MTEIHYYTCDCCGENFENEEECTKHELSLAGGEDIELWTVRHSVWYKIPLNQIGTFNFENIVAARAKTEEGMKIIEELFDIDGYVSPYEYVDGTVGDLMYLDSSGSCDSWINLTKTCEKWNKTLNTILKAEEE